MGFEHESEFRGDWNTKRNDSMFFWQSVNFSCSNSYRRAVPGNQISTPLMPFTGNNRFTSAECNAVTLFFIINRTLGYHTADLTFLVKDLITNLDFSHSGEPIRSGDRCIQSKLFSLFLGYLYVCRVELPVAVRL